MKPSEKKELKKYLDSHNLMTLATGSNLPWVSIVYYAVDKEFNLYFVSSPKSKHCQDIDKNNKVACAIYDSHTKNSEKKVGIQLVGSAQEIKGWEKTNKILAMWHRAAPGAEEIVNLKNMMAKVISSRFYKITPTKIKFFNQHLYEEAKEFNLK